MRVIKNTLNQLILSPGDYGRVDGVWYAKPPGFVGVANLSKHEVIEHENGTITVKPSILCECGDQKWHGFLEEGKWRKV